MLLYKDNNEKLVGELTVITTYFRLKTEGLLEFLAGYKALTPKEKDELATGAASELGWSVEQGS
jgi:hypothetical protein